MCGSSHVHKGRDGPFCCFHPLFDLIRTMQGPVHFRYCTPLLIYNGYLWMWKLITHKLMDQM